MIKSRLSHEVIKRMNYDQFVIKLATDLRDVEKKLFEKLDEINLTINKKVGPPGKDGRTPSQREIVAALMSFISPQVIRSHVESIVRQPEDGKPGKDGMTPIKGVHYFTADDIDGIVSVIEARLNIKNKSKLPKKEDDIFSVFEKGSKKLNIKHIDGLEQTLSAFRNQLDRRGGYIHGGGDTVKAGTNVTITSNSDGTKTISSSGGTGGGFTESNITSGAIDGTNKTFVMDAVCAYIIVNGVWYRQNKGWTAGSGTSITLDFAPVSGSDVWGVVGTQTGGANILTDASGNLLTDASGNLLTIN